MSDRYNKIQVNSMELDKYNRFLIEVTQRCNLQCKYCFYNTMKDRINEDLDLKDLEKLKNKTFWLTGGEPFLHAQIQDFIIEASKFNRVGIFTNGILLNKLDQSLYNNISRLYISLDSFDSIENNKLRQKSPDIQLLQKLNSLREDLVYLNITINQKNYVDFDEFLLQFTEKGFKNLSMNFVSLPISSEITHTLGLKNKKGITKSILNSLFRYKNMINIDRSHMDIRSDYYLENKFNPSECLANKQQLCFIDCRGALHKCPNFIMNEKCVNMTKCDSASFDQCIEYLVNCS